MARHRFDAAVCGVVAIALVGCASQTGTSTQAGAAPAGTAAATTVPPTVPAPSGTTINTTGPPPPGGIPSQKPNISDADVKAATAIAGREPHIAALLATEHGKVELVGPATAGTTPEINGAVVVYRFPKPVYVPAGVLATVSRKGESDRAPRKFEDNFYRTTERAKYADIGVSVFVDLAAGKVLSIDRGGLVDSGTVPQPS